MTGEVIAALLLLLAQDTVIADPNRKRPFPAEVPSSVPKGLTLKGDGGCNGRILTVLEFLGALLPAAEIDAVENLKPFRATAEGCGNILKNALADARVWFNHFIKVHDFDMVNQQYLWRLICREAALICVNNHRDIDIVIPIIFDLQGHSVKPEHVSAILIQVKNDRSFTANIRTSLFTGMDPFKVGLFSKGMKAGLPIIRMVFALASKDPTVKVIQPSPASVQRTTRARSSPMKSDKFTTYDIWIAGATNKSFGVIEESGIGTYTKLLERSCKNFNGYDLIDKAAIPSEKQIQRRADARRRMHPGAATAREHYQNYISSAEEFFVELGDSEEDV